MGLASVWPLLGTLAVVIAWVIIAVVISGVGYATRRLLLFGRTGVAPAPLQPADFWIGLAALTAYLLFFALLWPVSQWSWLLPLVAGGAGAVIGFGSLRSARPPIPSAGLIVLLLAGVFLTANASLGPKLSYDLGLYQFGAIDYAARFGTVPGLGNLHDLLGSANSHLVFAAFLDHGPFSTFGYRLANGLLVSALFVELAWRLDGWFRRGSPPSFTIRVAALLVPATFVAAVGAGGVRVAAPNLDLAAFVLVAVGVLYLSSCVEVGTTSVAAMACASSLALASSTRPLYWPLTATAVVILMWKQRSAEAGRLPLTALVIPIGLLAGWLIRQSVLSGYPLFPLTTVRLPVDWRMPKEDADSMRQWVKSWAREPVRPPDEVLGSWRWLGPWLRARTHDPDLLAPLLLLVAAVPGLWLASPEDARRRRQWRWPLLSVLLPVLATLALWFSTAPDPRFVLAPLWLTSIALVAWGLPSLRRGGRLRTWISAGCVITALLLGIGGAAAKARYRPVIRDRGGPLGAAPVPTPALDSFRTRSGLSLERPAEGDQCWRAPLCTPYPNAGLRLRGASLGDGFRIGCCQAVEPSLGVTTTLAPVLRSRRQSMPE